MYIIIRLIIGCIFVASSMIAIKKSKVLHKRILYIIFTGLSVRIFDSPNGVGQNKRL